MSKFGFQNAARILPEIMSSATRRMGYETVEYFRRNFDKESWGSVKWEPLHPDTRSAKTADRPILDVVGRLKEATVTGLHILSIRSFSIDIDPVDERGRGYAKYHNEGTGRPGQGYAYNPQRSFAKQNEELEAIQLQLLKEQTGRIWSMI